MERFSRSRLRATFLLGAALSLAACGGGMMVDAGNPLEGSWGGDGTMLGQAELPSETISNSITLGTGGALAGTESGSPVTNVPMSDMIYGCQYNATFTGMWSTRMDPSMGTVLTIMWTRHTTESGCVHFITGEIPPTSGSDDFAATVNGSTLTLTRVSGSGMSGAMYTLTR
jgi:hypothetical protein